MTPREALHLLDQAAAQIMGSRQDHLSIQRAVSVLNELVSQTDRPAPNPSLPLTDTEAVEESEKEPAKAKK